MSHIHSGYRFEVQVYPSRAATYLKLAAVSLFGALVSLAMWIALA